MHTSLNENLFLNSDKGSDVFAISGSKTIAAFNNITKPMCLAVLKERVQWV
jgi:hypothetical protein